MSRTPPRPDPVIYVRLNWRQIDALRALLVETCSRDLTEREPDYAAALRSAGKAINESWGLFAARRSRERER